MRGMRSAPTSPRGGGRDPEPPGPEGNRSLPLLALGKAEPEVIPFPIQPSSSSAHGQGDSTSSRQTFTFPGCCAFFSTDGNIWLLLETRWVLGNLPLKFLQLKMAPAQPNALNAAFLIASSGHFTHLGVSPKCHVFARVQELHPTKLTDLGGVCVMQASLHQHTSHLLNCCLFKQVNICLGETFHSIVECSGLKGTLKVI